MAESIAFDYTNGFGYPLYFPFATTLHTRSQGTQLRIASTASLAIPKSIRSLRDLEGKTVTVDLPQWRHLRDCG